MATYAVGSGADWNVATCPHRSIRCTVRWIVQRLVVGVRDWVDLFVVCTAIVGQMNIRVGVGTKIRADICQFGTLPLRCRNEAGAWADSDGISAIEHAKWRTGLCVKGRRQCPIVAE